LARGGFYGRETAQASAEHAESYLRTVFGLVGIQQPEFVLAEGLATGEHNKLSAVSAARSCGAAGGLTVP
jgi:FMN-dependent NADH-azoreductase